jgi:hypothetical protein
MTRNATVRAESTRPVWHKRNNPLGHASRYKSRHQPRIAKISPIKRKSKLSTPAHEYPIDHLVPCPPASSPAQQHHPSHREERRGSLHIGFDQLFGKRRRGRAPRPKCSPSTATATGRINRAKRQTTHDRGTSNIFSAGAQGQRSPYRSSRRSSPKPTAPRAGPSLTTPASASLISGKIPGRSFNVRLGTADRRWTSPVADPSPPDQCGRNMTPSFGTVPTAPSAAGSHSHSLD